MRNPLTQVVGGRTYKKVFSSTFIERNNTQVLTDYKPKPVQKSGHSVEISATKKAIRYLSVLESIKESNKKVIFNHENNEILVK